VTETRSSQFPKTGLRLTIRCNVTLLEASYATLRCPVKPSPATTMCILIYLAVNLQHQNKIPLRNAACRDFILEILIFKGLTARRLCKSFDVIGLRKVNLELYQLHKHVYLFEL
jgi:hypothetical protein